MEAVDVDLRREQPCGEGEPLLACDASIDSTKEVASVAAISVRNLDKSVKERLRVRAARHGRSMESEIRAILMEAVSEPHDADDLFESILDRFGEIGGVELELPPRRTPARPADLSP